MKTKLLFLFFLGFLSYHSNAQLYKWTVPISASGADEECRGLAYDTAGNVYITGWFQGTVDFDRGPGVASISAFTFGNNDVFLAKYDRNGNYLWAKKIGGFGQEQGYDIAVDDTGNIYLSGMMSGGFDPDPGSGLPVMNAVGIRDVFFAKYNTNGVCQWAKSFGSSADDEGFALDIDSVGNIYLAGYYSGTTDFDPGAGVASLTCAGSADIYFGKYSNSGNYIWAKSISGVNWDLAEGIKVAPSGNIYVTGRFQATVDFDPGAGTDMHTVLGSAFTPDAFVAKYDNNGNYIWGNQVGGTSDDFSWELEIDQSENVYITGDFYATIDFDPGAGVANLTSGGQADIFFAKYNADGTYAWAKKIGGTSDDVGWGIDVDRFGEVYITGYFKSSADFDPGAGVSTLSATGIYQDLYFAKYTTTGNFIWAKKLGGNGNEFGREMIVNDSGYVFLSGYFSSNASTMDFDFTSGTDVISALGQEDGYLTKFSQLPAAAGPITGSASACQFGTVSFSVATILYATGYNWSLPPGATILSGTNTNSITLRLDTAGTYTISVEGTNAFGPGVASDFNITIYPSPLAILSSSDTVICLGSSIILNAAVTGGTPGYTYMWAPVSGSGSSLSDTPLANTGYMVTATDANGCASSDTLDITVNSITAASIISDDTLAICAGDFVILNAQLNPGVTYQWQLNGSDIIGATDSTYTANAIGAYSVIVSNSFSCNDTSSNVYAILQTDCDVWPGDANGDHVVDNNDLLSLGLYFGYSGTARATTSDAWLAYPSTSWGIMQAGGFDLKHSDCNGDGIINDDDTLAVNLNFSLTHAIAHPVFDLRSTVPLIHFVTASGTYVAGDWVDVEVWAGTSSDPVAQLYGIAFDLGYDAAFVEPGTVSISYPPSWIGTKGVDAISVFANDGIANTAYGAFTRIDHVDASGFGKIAVLRFQVNTTLSSVSSFTTTLSGYNANNAEGDSIMFNSTPNTLTFNPMPLGVNESNDNLALNVFPNPYTSEINIMYQLEQTSDVVIEVYNSLGQTVQTLANATQMAGSYKFNFSAKELGMDAGIYFVKISIDGKVTMKKIVEMK